MRELTAVDVEGHMKNVIDPALYKNIPAEARNAAVSGIADALNSQQQNVQRGR